MKAILSPFLAIFAFALPALAQEATDLGPGAKSGAAQIMPVVVPSTTLNGAIGSGSGGSCEASGNSAIRIYRDAVSPACAAPKVFPGTFGTGPFYYDTYQVVNATGATQCVTMTIVAPVQAHLMVYNGSFDPNNFGANYMADSGSSSVSSTPQGLSVSVSSNQTVMIVVQDPTASRTGNTYTLTFDYLTVNCGPLFDLYFEDEQLRSRLWLNSTSGAWSMDMLAGPLVGNYTGTTTPILKNGVIALPLPTVPGLAVWGFFDPSTRRATFTLRPPTPGYHGFLLDLNTTGQPPAPGMAK